MASTDRERAHFLELKRKKKEEIANKESCLSATELAKMRKDEKEEADRAERKSSMLSRQMKQFKGRSTAARVMTATGKGAKVRTPPNSSYIYTSLRQSCITVDEDHNDVGVADGVDEGIHIQENGSYSPSEERYFAENLVTTSFQTVESDRWDDIEESINGSSAHKVDEYFDAPPVNGSHGGELLSPDIEIPLEEGFQTAPHPQDGDEESGSSGVSVQGIDNEGIITQANLYPVEIQRWSSENRRTSCFQTVPEILVDEGKSRTGDEFKGIDDKGMHTHENLPPPIDGMVPNKVTAWFQTAADTPQDDNGSSCNTVVQRANIKKPQRRPQQSRCPPDVERLPYAIDSRDEERECAVSGRRREDEQLRTAGRKVVELISSFESQRSSCTNAAERVVQIRESANFEPGKVVELISTFESQESTNSSSTVAGHNRKPWAQTRGDEEFRPGKVVHGGVKWVSGADSNRHIFTKRSRRDHGRCCLRLACGGSCSPSRRVTTVVHVDKNSKASRVAKLAAQFDRAEAEKAAKAGCTQAKKYPSKVGVAVTRQIPRRRLVR